jgi:hypothetical protein
MWFHLFRSADRLKNERKLCILYSQKCFPILSHPAPFPPSPPPLNYGMGWGWPRAERSLDISHVYVPHREAKGRFCPCFFGTFIRKLKFLRSTYLLQENIYFFNIEEHLAFNTTRSFSSLAVLFRVNLCFVLFVQFKLNVFYSSKIHQRFFGKPQNGCFLIDRYSGQREWKISTF